MAEHSKHRYWVGATQNRDHDDITKYLLDMTYANPRLPQTERAKFLLTLNLDEYEVVIKPLHWDLVSVVVNFTTTQAVEMKLLDIPDADGIHG